MDSVLADFDSQLAAARPRGDPKAILAAAAERNALDVAALQAADARVDGDGPRTGSRGRPATAGRHAAGVGIRPAGSAGWLFVAPVVVILGLFLLLPILMALWVSFTDWNGQGSPFTARRAVRRRWTTTPACSPRTAWPARTS